MAKKTSTIKTLDDYIQVTRTNLRMALSIGSWYYVIRKKGNQYEILDVGHVRPRLRKGAIVIHNFPASLSRTSTVDIFVRDEETPEQYDSHEWAPMWQMIDAGVIYVHKTKREKAIYTLKPIR